LGAKPAVFKKSRLLLVGCGDVGHRLLKLLGSRWRVTVLTSDASKLPAFKALGVRALYGNLDKPHTLARLSGMANRVVHLAPPAPQGAHDERTQNLLQVLNLRTAPQHFVYACTTGVYGDCAGEWVSEWRSLNPQSDRATRRVDAEQRLRYFGRLKLGATKTAVLRIPGIYALDRVGGTPLERLKKGLPILKPEQDVYTNHIHADDLARALLRALVLQSTLRAFNVSDDTELKMGEYFAWAAKAFGLPSPPCMDRSDIQSALTPMQWSFMQESRRLVNLRMKRELKLVLRYPTIQEGLSAQGS
jgi:nucleoside-diphosphate-sugar epimerase